MKIINSKKQEAATKMEAGGYEKLLFLFLNFQNPIWKNT